MTESDRTPEIGSIPRFLHRIVLPPLQAKGDVEAYWTRFAELHEDWQLRTWSGVPDDEWEMASLLPHCSTPAAQADLLRLEILWRYGGIYVDTDCEPVRSLDGLLNYSFFIGTDDGFHLANTVMGCSPGHPAIRAYMDAIIQEERIYLSVPPNEAVGPYLATAVLGHRDDVTVLPPEFFYPEPYDARYAEERLAATEIATPFTYMVHRWAHSWQSVDPVGVEPRTQAAISDRVMANAKRVGRGLRRRLTEPAPVAAPGSFGCYVGNDRIAVRLPDESCVVAVASDLSITPELISRGIYDEPFWRFLPLVIRPGDRVVDVGANIGLFTVRMAQLVAPFGHVDAFEPDAELASITRANVRSNWLDGRVRVHPIALAGRPGLVDFYQNAGLRGLSTTAPAARLDRDARADLVASTVEAARLDDVLPQSLPIRLVKVDVEGAESDVLDGMSGLLSSGCVQMLDLEVVRPNAGHEWLRLVDWMRRLERDLGGQPHLIRRDGHLDVVALDHVIATAGQYPHVVFLLDALHRRRSVRSPHAVPGAGRTC